MILSDRGKKHVEAITKYCLENGMEDVSMMGLRNHLARLVKRIEILEERAAKQKESSPTSHNKQSTPCSCCGGTGMSVIWKYCPQCGREV